MIFLVGAFLMSVSCKKKAKEYDDTYHSGVIDFACDESFKTLIDAEIDVFGVHFPEAFVFPRYTTEKNAIDLLIADSVKLAITSRDLDDVERGSLTNNRTVRKYLFAFDGVVLLVNKANADSMLTVANLKKILTGEITEWNQINPSSKLGAIRTIFANKESSVLRYLIDSVTKTTNLSKNIYALDTKEEVFDRVREMPNAIGIVGFNQLGSQRGEAFREITAKTQLVRISSADVADLSNSYLPFQGELNEGKYPLWRPVYVLLGEGRTGLATGFCFFLTQEVSQKIILKMGLMPITDAQNQWTEWTVK
ncbi:MAG: substrate-binding domain-containing protein [Dysgonamonadaceae bacterium]|jgi:phosphate transport system substrate-binding protein|nr:substrate-binding domain-containing protein [Dysgonamonadaceae bacterium]